MNTVIATASVAGEIADIERRRRATAAEAGITMACSAALHRLQDLLKHEAEALRLRGPASAHVANVEAVSAEIVRVKRLSTVLPAGKTSRPMSRATGR